MKIDYSLYLIVDTTPLEIIADILDHGVSCVQLRIKDQPLEAILSSATLLHALLKTKNIPLIINDYIEIAKAIGADGVHIGQNDQSYTQARKALGYNKIIGFSIQNLQQAKQCQHMDCDYFGVGPIFATTTKSDASPPIGIQHLQKIVSLLPKPVVAIGGINENTLQPLLTIPIAGVALAAGILSAASPKQATQAIAQSISQRPAYAKQV